MRVSLGDLTCDESGCYESDPTAPVTVTTLNPYQGDCVYGQAPSGYCNPAPVTTQPKPPASNSIAAFLASLTNAASGAVRAATTPAPYLIPGTNTLFNPATGQIAGATPSAAVAGGGSLMLLLLAGIAIFALEKR